MSKHSTSVNLCSWQFCPKLVPTIATVVTSALLISLGFWQLDRAKQKRDLLVDFANNAKQQAITITEVKKQTAAKLRYHKLTLSGNFLNKFNLLLDNKLYQGRIGYHLYTPFVPIQAPNTVLLVYRGWLQGLPNKQKPKIPLRAGQQTITVIIDQPQQSSLLLGVNIAPNDSWPLIMQQINYQAISSLLKLKSLPFIGVLPQPESGSLQADYNPGAILPPSRHIAYAVQWFALALTLVIIYIFVNSKRKDHEQP